MFFSKNLQTIFSKSPGLYVNMFSICINILCQSNYPFNLIIFLLQLISFFFFFATVRGNFCFILLQLGKNYNFILKYKNNRNQSYWLVIIILVWKFVSSICRLCKMRKEDYSFALYTSNVYYYLYACSFSMAPHSSTLAWKIPWMEEPGRL